MNRMIVFVIAPGFEPLDLSGPMCAFNCARARYGAPYELAIVSATGGPVAGCAGFSIATIDPSAIDEVDTLVAVGGPEAHLPDDHPPTIDLLRRLAPEARRVASVCSGAFYLASARILEGRRVTTHWRWAALLQSRFPSVSVDADRIFVNDDGIWTSAGVTAGIDLALALIEADVGIELSKAVARELVVYHRRPGGQSQFSAILDLEPASARIKDALTYAREHLHEDLSVDRLADAACVSGRQFARLFVKETGQTPAKAVERIRAEVARPMVEESGVPIERIARHVGFGDAERMRRGFLRQFGQSPQTMRRLARDHGALVAR